MPGGPDQDGDHHLHLLDAAWYKTRQHWHDDPMVHFDTRYWTQLRNESRAYLSALRELMQLVDAAERETEY